MSNRNGQIALTYIGLSTYANNCRGNRQSRQLTLIIAFKKAVEARVAVVHTSQYINTQFLAHH